MEPGSSPANGDIAHVMTPITHRADRDVTFPCDLHDEKRVLPFSSLDGCG